MTHPEDGPVEIQVGENRISVVDAAHRRAAVFLLVSELDLTPEEVRIAREVVETDGDTDE